MNDAGFNGEKFSERLLFRDDEKEGRVVLFFMKYEEGVEEE